MMDMRESDWREELKILERHVIYEAIADAQNRIGSYALSSGEIKEDDPYVHYQRSIVTWCREELERRKGQ